MTDAEEYEWALFKAGDGSDELALILRDEAAAQWWLDLWDREGGDGTFYIARRPVGRWERVTGRGAAG